MTQTPREQMLERWRSMVARDREVLALWRENRFRFLTNGEDTTEADMIAFETRIADLESLIARVEASDA